MPSTTGSRRYSTKIRDRVAEYANDVPVQIRTVSVVEVCVSYSQFQDSGIAKSIVIGQCP